MIDHKEERKERAKFETMEERRIRDFQQKTEKEDLREALRNKILFLFENGMSATDISNELHLTVSKVLAYKATRS